MDFKEISLGKKCLLLIAIGLYIGLYLLINSLLDLKEVWVGLLLFWYWGMEKHASFESLKAILPGSISGVVAAYALHTLPHAMGMPGVIGSLIIILFLVLSTFTGWFKLWINGTTFLVLTAASIPAIVKPGNYFHYLGYMEVIIVCCCYLGISSYLMGKGAKFPKNEDQKSQVK